MRKIPAIPLFLCVRQWAQANDLPFFTLREQRKAVARYVNFQSQNN